MADVIEISVLDREARARFRQILERVQNKTPLMRRIAGRMNEAVMQNFDEEGRPKKWAPLARATIEAREKRGHWPGKILVSGRPAGLKESITSRHDNETAAVGTNKIYGPTHQFGRGRMSSIKTRRQMPAVPARPFLGLTDGDLQEIVEMGEEYLGK